LVTSRDSELAILEEHPEGGHALVQGVLDGRGHELANGEIRGADQLVPEDALHLIRFQEHEGRLILPAGIIDHAQLLLVAQPLAPLDVHDPAIPKLVHAHHPDHGVVRLS